MTDQKHTKDHWETISNGIKPIDQIWISQVKNLQITLSLLTKQRDELREALKPLNDAFEKLSLLDSQFSSGYLGTVEMWLWHHELRKIKDILTKTKGAV